MNACRIDNQKTLNRVVELLKESNLPYQDIILEGNLFIAYEDGTGNLVGAGGLELYGGYSLLRSVVVEKEQRGKKIGKAIVSDLMSRARNESIKKVYLLTETAPAFFQSLGFTVISREQAPEQVKASLEFTSVCPVSAVCMEFQTQEHLDLT